MGGSTETYPQIPGDVSGTRTRVANSLNTGSFQPPSYEPLYSPSGFQPSRAPRAGYVPPPMQPPGAIPRQPLPPASPIGTPWNPVPSGQLPTDGIQPAPTQVPVGQQPFGSNPVPVGTLPAGMPRFPVDRPTGLPSGITPMGSPTDPNAEPDIAMLLNWARQTTMAPGGTASNTSPNGLPGQEPWERPFGIAPGSNPPGGPPYYIPSNNPANSPIPLPNPVGDTPGVPQYSVPSGGETLPGIGNIFPRLPSGPPGSPIAPLPQYDVAGTRDIGGVNAATAQYDPRFGSAIDQLLMGAGGAAGGMGSQSQSINQLLDPNSEFFKQITGALGGSFDQSRSLALAQAKESAGNLTGSGLANVLGNTVNRSLADQNRQVTEGLLGAAGMEMQRQTAADQLRQTGMQSGRRDLVDLANILQAQGEGQAGRQQQANLTGYDFQRQRALADSSAENQANSQFFQAGVDRNSQQAQMDQERMLAEFQAATGMSRDAANNYLQLLLGMTTSGVGPPVTTKSGGFDPGVALQLLDFLKNL